MNETPQAKPVLLVEPDGHNFSAIARPRIPENTGAGHLAVGSIRRRLVRRFPYAILYATRPGVVRVLAVMNLK